MEEKDRIQKPETTEKYHHIPVKKKELFVKRSFRTITLSASQGILAVIGKLKTDPQGSTKTQKYLFDVKKWTMAEAKAWVKEHKTKDIEYAVNLFLLFENKYNIKTEDGILSDIEEAIKSKEDDLDENVSFFNWQTEKEIEENKSIELEKDEEGNQYISHSIIIKKKDEMKRLVYGIVYTPDKADYHKHFATKEEIEKTAHAFLLNARRIDRQHDFIKGSGGVVESFLARKGDPDFPEGAWVIVTKVFSDKVWEQVLAGVIKGYSMAGVASMGDTKEVETDLDIDDKED